MADGILIIDKPAGITSHDVVARCRRILQTKRIGHTGTLDPFATGVMVVLVGKATRLAQFLDKDAKSYEALVRYGFETETGDRDGAPRPADGAATPEISEPEIAAALSEFRGPIMQTPPMYSAKKVDGKKLYELARAGVEIERAALPVTIYELELIEGSLVKNADATTDFSLVVSCSAGTYIRVLAEDIGRRLGGGAHLAALRRTKAGRFGAGCAVTLEELERIVAADDLAKFVVPMNSAVSHLTEIKLGDEQLAKVRNGMRLRGVGPFRDGETLRLSFDGELAAVGWFDAGENCVRPKLVLV